MGQLAVWPIDGLAAGCLPAWAGIYLLLYLFPSGVFLLLLFNQNQKAINRTLPYV